MTSPRLGSYDNPERDAWLTEALRHAPDADAAPPTALRESILREARAATAGTRTVPAPSTAHRLLAAWSWLARPPVATGFASVMVATVTGLMWWDRPIDETLQRPPMPASTLAPGVQQPAAVVQPTPGTLPTPPAPAARADKAAARAAPAPAAPRTQATPERAEPAAFTDEPKSVAAAPAAEVAAGAQGDTAPTVRMRESTPRGTADATVAAARDDSAMPSVGLSARALGKASQAPATSGALTSAPRKSEAAAPTAPLTELLASVAEQPQRWSWQRSGNVQPMSPALQRWLQQLDRTAASQWRAPAGVARPGEGSAARLYRDDTPYATLRLDDDAVWLVLASPAARPLRATLPAAALADLKRALDEATP
jgi:hypothetical protein